MSLSRRPTPTILAAEDMPPPQRILRSVREMISEVGYTGLTMRDIARRANVALQTLYNHYKTKDELVLEAITELLEARYAEAASRVGEPGWELILEGVEQQVRQIEATPKYAEAMTIALLQSTALDPLTKILVRDVRNDSRRSLLAMQDRSELRPGTVVDHVADLLAGAIWAPMVLWQKGYLPLTGLRRTARNQQLCVLIAFTRGKTRKELERRLLAQNEGD